jgi:branched-chain amino acid transport system permease protein
MNIDIKNHTWIAFLLFAAALLLLPVFVTNNFYLHNLIMIFFWATLTASWNIIGGFAGQLSLGHAAFFGIGAYTSTVLFLTFGISPCIGVICGGVLSTLVAAAISYPCFRLRGPFFTLSTIAFGEVVFLLSSYFRDLTGGAVGLLIPFKPGFWNLIFREKIHYYYIALFLMLVVIVVTHRIAHSKMGYYLISLREDEDAAKAIGIDTARYKLYAVMISAFFAGIAGVFYAQYVLFIEPKTVFSAELSTQFALMSIIGGLGTVAGPIVGAFILTPLSEFLRAWLGGSYSGLHLAIYGVILIVVVIMMPEGIVVWFNEKIRLVKARISKGQEVKP